MGYYTPKLRLILNKKFSFVNIMDLNTKITYNFMEKDFLKSLK